MDSAHPPFLSLLFSDDFPGHFEPDPPRSGELFAFHRCMLFEAEDAVMRLKRPCCPTERHIALRGCRSPPTPGGRWEPPPLASTRRLRTSNPWRPNTKINLQGHLGKHVDRNTLRSQLIALVTGSS